MRNPVLYDGRTMNKRKILHPISLKLDLKEYPSGLSSATMVMPPEEHGFRLNQWVGIWSPTEIFNVFYIKSTKVDELTGLETLELEHCLGLLEGMVAFGEYYADDMGGSGGKVDICTAIRFMLSKQPDSESCWAMRTQDCEPTDQQGWKVSNEDILGAIKGFTDAVQDCWFDFDMRQLPWRLSLKNWATVPTIEMRMSRNIQSLSINKDATKLYTRAYPTGKNGLHIDSVNSGVSYIDRNTALYGIVAEVITDSTISDAALLKAWAQKQLKRNSKPYMTITVGGQELSELSGETMDRFTIGALCNIVADSEVYSERIIGLRWKDAVQDEIGVTVTLGEPVRTLSSVLNERAKGGGAGGKKANNDKDTEFGEEEGKWYEFHNTDLWINKEAIWGVCGAYEVSIVQGVKHIRLKDGSLLEITKDGIVQTVGTVEYTDAQVGVVTGSALWTQRNAITGVCGKFTVSGNNLLVNDGTELKITRDGADLSVYDSGNLSAAVIVNKINGGTATITANHVVLSGTTTTVDSKLTTIDSDIVNITTGETLCGKLNTAILEVNHHSASAAPYEFLSPYYQGNNLYIPYNEFGGSQGLITVDVSGFVRNGTNITVGTISSGAITSTGNISGTNITGSGTGHFNNITTDGAIVSGGMVSATTSLSGASLTVNGTTYTNTSDGNTIATQSWVTSQIPSTANFVQKNSDASLNTINTTGAIVSGGLVSATTTVSAPTIVASTTMTVGGNAVATQSWVNSQGFVTTAGAKFSGNVTVGSAGLRLYASNGRIVCQSLSIAGSDIATEAYVQQYVSEHIKRHRHSVSLTSGTENVLSSGSHNHTVGNWTGYTEA